jgi:hypothetical protein
MEPIIFRMLRIPSIALVLTLLGSSQVSPSTVTGLEAEGEIAFPDGSVATVKEGDIFRSQAGAERTEQLTFTLGRVHSAAPLPDGRILYLYRDSGIGRLFTMLPDGTWSTLWPGLEDLSISAFRVANEEQLLVSDSEEGWWSVSIADPFAPRQRLTTDLAALARPKFQVDPLPSIVKPEMSTGYLFVIDVARTDDPALRGLDRHEVAQLKVLELSRSGSERTLATILPASDGSVYLEAPADTPLGLEMIDQQGRVLARTQTPIWIRPNERRGCIGCHVSPAFAPPNIRPEALVQEPYRIGTENEVAP